VPEGEVAPVGAVVGVIAKASGCVANAPPKQAAQQGRHQGADSPQAGSRNIGVAALSRHNQAGRASPFLRLRTPERIFGPARLPGGISSAAGARLASDGRKSISGV